MRFNLWRRGAAAVTSASASSALPDLGAAPELRGISRWFNAPTGGEPALGGMLGRVVMVEFWTFACINCVRTLPFVEEMHET